MFATKILSNAYATSFNLTIFYEIGHILSDSSFLQFIHFACMHKIMFYYLPVFKRSYDIDII